MAVSAVAAASVASAAAAGYGVVQSRNAAKSVDNARRNADITASRNANARLAMQRQAMRDNNLLTAPPGSDTLGSA